MKLSDQILNTLKGYTSKIVDNVLIEYQDGAHDKKNNLIQFLNDVASVSDKISVVLKSGSKGLDPLKFEIKKMIYPMGFILMAYHPVMNSIRLF